MPISYWTINPLKARTPFISGVTEQLYDLLKYILYIHGAVSCFYCRHDNEYGAKGAT